MNKYNAPQACPPATHIGPVCRCDQLWRPPWWAGWLHLAVFAFAMVGWIDVAVGRAPSWPECALGETVLGALLLGIFNPRSQGFAPAFCGSRHCRTRIVALTFDDGPDPTTTPRVLDALGANRATFFVIGRKAREHPHLISELLARGHAVMPHGEDHSWIDMMTVRGARGLVRECLRSLEGLGVPRARFFRPRYGLITPPLLVALREVGLTLVGWRLRTFDTVRYGQRDHFAERFAARVRNGDIVLLHDAPNLGSRPEPLGVTATSQLVTELRAREFTLVTLNELFEGAARDDI
jgi:peptidoglycan/xylan/chitin deacetylase (PgdA/CDA1 family)